MFNTVEPAKQVNNKKRFDIKEFAKTDKARMIILIAIIVIEVIVFSSNPKFLTASNLLDAFRTYTEIAIIALGMTFVLMSDGIDLSVGSLLALVSITIGFTHKAGCPLAVSLLLGMLVGALGGLFNGVVIVYGKVHAFVVTLGTFSLYRGRAYGLTNAESYSDFPAWFGFFGNSYIGGVLPVQFVIYILLAVTMFVIFKMMPYGTHVSALGYNSVAAKFSGIRVNRDKIMVYMISGILVGIAAVIYTSRMSASRGNAGENMEMYAIAAAVLGGTSMSGGHGSLEGTIVATFILALMKNGIAMLGFKNDWALFITGALVLASMILNRVMQQNSKE